VGRHRQSQNSWTGLIAVLLRLVTMGDLASKCVKASQDDSRLATLMILLFLMTTYRSSDPSSGPRSVTNRQAFALAEIGRTPTTIDRPCAFCWQSWGRMNLRELYPHRSSDPSSGPRSVTNRQSFAFAHSYSQMEGLPDNRKTTSASQDICSRTME
jgi:hypothetical protein